MGDVVDLTPSNLYFAGPFYAARLLAGETFRLAGVLVKLCDLPGEILELLLAARPCDLERGFFMARIRTIKPEFWTSDQVVECSVLARLLFIGMWTHADDGGVLPANPRRLKMQVFPGDAVTPEEIRDLVEELVGEDLVVQYRVEDRWFWQITGWRRHQRIDRPTYRYPKADHERAVVVKDPRIRDLFEAEPDPDAPGEPEVPEVPEVPAVEHKLASDPRGLDEGSGGDGSVGKGADPDGSVCKKEDGADQAPETELGKRVAAIEARARSRREPADGTGGST